MDKISLIEMAKDVIQKKVNSNYSNKEAADTLIKAFIDANGGSSKVGVKEFRRNPELYNIMEEIIPTMIVEGLSADEFFIQFVDYRNEALGDDTDFWIPDNSLFIVSDAANGTQGIRRQRLDVGQKVNIAKTLKVIKVYEELNRLLARRVDFNTFIDRVSKSYLNYIYTEMYNTLDGISATTTGFTTEYYKTGSYSEDVLLTLIGHVEAASGTNAKIIGTKSALRKVTTATVSESAKESMNAIGYYGVFNGTPMISARQAHKIGTDEFIFDDTKLYVVASDDKFIKHVDSGEGLFIDSDPMSKADLTKEYLYGQTSGTGIILSSRVGIYDLV